MRLPVLAVVLAAALLALPLAAGHGASTREVKDQGPYRIVFHTFDGVTEGEQVRLAWNVTLRDSGARVRFEDPAVELSAYRADGSLAERKRVELEQRIDGFLFGDVTIGPQGRMVYVLPLPEGGPAQFEQPVLPGFTGGRLDDPPPAKTPGPGALAAATLAALAAWGLARARARP